MLEVPHGTTVSRELQSYFEPRGKIKPGKTAGGMRYSCTMIDLYLVALGTTSVCMCERVSKKEREKFFSCNNYL